MNPLGENNGPKKRGRPSGSTAREHLRNTIESDPELASIFDSITDNYRNPDTSSTISSNRPNEQGPTTDLPKSRTKFGRFRKNDTSRDENVGSTPGIFGTASGNSRSARDNDSRTSEDSSESERDSSRTTRTKPKGLVPSAVPKGSRGSKPSSGFSLPWLEGVQPLSSDEILEIRENIIVGLESTWSAVDEIISRTNKAKQEAIIWQLIDREDTEYLADSLLRIGAKVPQAAYAIRQMAQASHQYRIGVILLPRFLATWDHYANYGGFKL